MTVCINKRTCNVLYSLKYNNYAQIIVCTNNNELLSAISYPDLQINGNKIECVTKFNFLGLVLQSTLS